jgi:stage V sporulation protein S
VFLLASSLCVTTREAGEIGHRAGRYPSHERRTVPAVGTNSSHSSQPQRASVEVLKVSSRSNPNAVAGAMAGVIRQAGSVEVQIVGAGALNQAIKALAIARGYVSEAGIDLVCVPTFADIEIDGERRTAIRLHIDDRAGRMPDPNLLRDVPIVLEGHSEYADDGAFATNHRD